jgi:molybdopterin-guanine dinucleotide biosynthesis protein B
LKPPAIAVVGAKKVGKTTTTEKLVIELTRRGYRVAAVKHINEPEFTMDTPGKDTWRYQQAGAKTIIAVSPNETATIEKTATPLQAVLKKCEGNDIILIEGFKKTVAQDPSIPKIAVTTSQEQAEAALENYKPIIAFSGPHNPKNTRIPYADATKNPEKLADLIEKTLKKANK